MRIFLRNRNNMNKQLKTTVMKEDLEKEMQEVQNEIDFHTKELHKKLTKQKELSKKLGRNKKSISLEWTVSPHLFFHILEQWIEDGWLLTNCGINRVLTAHILSQFIRFRSSKGAKDQYLSESTVCQYMKKEHLNESY